MTSVLSSGPPNVARQTQPLTRLSLDRGPDVSGMPPPESFPGPNRNRRGRSDLTLSVVLIQLPFDIRQELHQPVTCLDRDFLS